jgi:hypothetical protein
MRTNRIVGIVAFFVAFLVVLSAVYIAVREPFSTAVNDCRALETYSREFVSNQGDENYLDQQIRACKGEDLDESEKPGGGASSSPTPTPSAEPTEETQPRQWEYLANRPPVQKTAINSFGPSQGLTVDMPLADMDVDQAIAEMRYRLSIDPMLAAATKAAFERTDYEGSSYAEVDANTKLFSEDYEAWDTAVAEINRKIDEAVAAGQVGIEPLSGNYVASYSIPGEIPAVRIDYDVPRWGQTAIRISDELFQLECGIQNYWEGSLPIQGPQIMPEPSPGMDRTPEGTPIVEVPPAQPEKPETTVPPTAPPTTVPPSTTPPTTVPPTAPPTTTLEPKPSEEDSYAHETGAPQASTTGPARESAEPVDTNPAPTEDRDVPTEAPGANNPDAGGGCVTAPGESSC